MSVTSTRRVEPMRSIPELDQAADIDVLIDRYEAEHGQSPLNISHWNPSPEFQRRMTPRLRFANEPDPLSYIFSEALDSRDAIVRKLGFDPARHACIITPSGTTSTLCAANWIASARIPDVTVLCPTYFVTLHQNRLLDFSVTKRYMQRRDGRYHLPANFAGPEGAAPLVWITNPVFCTGVHVSNEDVARLGEYMRGGGRVFVDECTALAGTEIGPRLAEASEGFMGVYSPHKSVSMNGVKFSVLVFERRYLRFFQQWTDVIHGGLSSSNLLAVKHYLSDNFSEYQRAFEEATAETRLFLAQIVEQTTGVELDSGASGQWATIYYPDLPADFGLDLRFFEGMIRSTAGTLIPGARSHFDPSIGACFRVNLAKESPIFRGTLVRLLRYLARAETRAYFSSAPRAP